MQLDSFKLSPPEHYERGLALLAKSPTPEAYEHLSRAYLGAPQKASYRSAYALGLALVKGQFLGAVELARGAVREEFYNAELYLNLARIYEAFGFKAEAIRYLRRGLMVDPNDQGIRNKLAHFGERRRPPLRFLPRGHWMNRVLGRIQARCLDLTGRPGPARPAVAA